MVPKYMPQGKPSKNNINILKKNPKGGGGNPKVCIVVIEFLTDWKEAKIYRWTQFEHKLRNK